MYEAFKKVYDEEFGDDPKKYLGYNNIVNERHFKRLTSVYKRQKELPHSEEFFGGLHDSSDNFIAPTGVKGVKLSDPLMEDELFGGYLPFLEVADEDEAIKVISER